jgi:hypothetical protein
VVGEKLTGPLPPPPVYQLNHAVENDAQPKIYDQAQIKLIRTVAPRCRQLRHQHKEVKQVPDNHGNRLLE